MYPSPYSTCFNFVKVFQSARGKQKMSNVEKLCLKWNEFQENLSSAFAVLRNDQDLADVTLVCEDGTQIETHKVILASSSPFFMEVLKKNKHPHPLIYMRGVKAEALVAMIDFLYYGEVNVNQEILDVFLGLNESNTKEFRQKANLPENIEEVKNNVKTSRNTFGHIKNVYSSVKTEPSSVGLEILDANKLDEQIKSMMTRTENDKNVGTRIVKVYSCNVCGKENQGPAIKQHIEVNHITSNISHSCNICGKISRSRRGLRQHKVKEHSKVDVKDNIKSKSIPN